MANLELNIKNLPKEIAIIKTVCLHEDSTPHPDPVLSEINE